MKFEHYDMTIHHDTYVSHVSYAICILCMCVVRETKQAQLMPQHEQLFDNFIATVLHLKKCVDDCQASQQLGRLSVAHVLALSGTLSRSSPSLSCFSLCSLFSLSLFLWSLSLQ